jgi:multidrug/hemolysin transport system ATP-binding protein
MPEIIEVKSLIKNYKDIQAVKGIDFMVEEGSFFAFLGENGAGKSTTINIIATLIKKTSGDVIINQHHIDQEDELIRNDIGVVFQGNMLDKYLTVRENIINRGLLYGKSNKEINSYMMELSEKIGITDILDRRYGRLSAGQKRRVDIVRALINKPSILILDEPTTGLDPYSRKCVWEVISQLNIEKKLTIFLTTHYMEEAACSDYVVIMSEGDIKASGTPEQLKKEYSKDQLVFTCKKKDTDISAVDMMGYSYQRDRERVNVWISNSFEALKIIEALRDDIESFEVIKGTMDDVFLNVTSAVRSMGDCRHE